MTVGDLVRLKTDNVLPEWRDTIGMIIKNSDPGEIYIQHVTVLWPGQVETLSVKWLEVVDESR